MVLITMNNFFRFLFFFTLLLCFSCEEQGWIVNCKDCESTEPEQAYIELRLKAIGTVVPIKVFEGEIEDSILYFQSETSNDSYSFLASLNKKYTATATYYLNGKIYIAVDSAIPRVKYSEDQCDDPCYFVYDKVFDLRLKYKVPGD